MGFRVANDAALADVSASGFKLRLDEDNRLSERGRGGENGLQQQGYGDKRNVHDEKGELLAALSDRERAGGEKPGVGALKQADAGVGAELHGDLSEAGIDSSDVSGAVLEQAISEAAGGGADIEAIAPGNSYEPVLQGSGQLEAAAADVGRVFAEDANRRVFRDGDTGLVDFLFADENAAGENHGAGSLSAGNESAFHQQQINAGSGWSGGHRRPLLHFTAAESR